MAMRQLNGVYAARFNRRHGRVGHLFEGRFKGTWSRRMRTRSASHVTSSSTPSARGCAAIRANGAGRATARPQVSSRLRSS
jgi:hypothetical protein